MREHARLVERASAAGRFVLPSGLEEQFRRAPLAEEAAGRAGGKDFGSLFHELMSVVPLEPEEATDELLRGLARLEAASLGADGEAVDEAARLAGETVRNEEFRALLALGEVEREVAFCVPLEALGAGAGGFAEGSMDLLVRAAGRCVVLDYKTDRFGAGGQGRVAGRYWPQLGLYGLAARACGLAPGEVELALFFVRAGAIVRRPLDEALAAGVRRLAAEGAADEGALPAGREPVE